MKKILQPYGSSRRLLPLLSFFGHAYIGCELTFNKKKGKISLMPSQNFKFSKMPL
jgi:hypothetical protein